MQVLSTKYRGSLVTDHLNRKTGYIGNDVMLRMSMRYHMMLEGSGSGSGSGSNII